MDDAWLDKLSPEEREAAMNSEVDMDAEEGQCPACGSAFPTATGRCPDCGLNMGGGS